MKKFLIAVALFLGLASPALAQCNGKFSANQYCGTGASSGAPKQQPITNIFNTLPLANGNIYVGNASNIATAVAPSGSGDCTFTFSNLGVFGFTCLKTNGVSFGTLATQSGTLSGNGAKVMTGTGSFPNGDVAAFDANGNIVDGGGAVGNVTASGSPTNHQTGVWISGTGLKGIGPGTAGQAFVSNGASADPSYQSGQWVLLNTLTASNSANLTDTSSITATYTEYEIVIENMLAATASQTMQLQVQVSGTFQTSSYTGFNVFGSGSATNSTNITTGILIGNVTNAPTSGSGTMARLLLSTPAQTAAPKLVYGDYISTTPAIGVTGGSYTGANAAVTGVRLIMTSGNLTSGVMKIYGRVN